MEKTYAKASSPLVTAMIQVDAAEIAEKKIKSAIACGATAIGLQLGYLRKEDRSETVLRRLFTTAGGLPVYVTNYRGGNNEGKSDDELASELLFALSCGATLVDVPGDLFDPSPEELTTNETAIAKQKRLIGEVHRNGGEVLTSSHVNSFRNAERVLEMAKAQQARGADIVKIVTGAETKEEELENLRICYLLKKELDVPFLFLSGGECKLHRTIGPALGVCTWLCFDEYDEYSYPGPPLISEVLDVKRGLKL